MLANRGKAWAKVCWNREGRHNENWNDGLVLKWHQLPVWSGTKIVEWREWREVATPHRGKKWQLEAEGNGKGVVVPDRPL